MSEIDDKIESTIKTVRNECGEALMAKNNNNPISAMACIHFIKLACQKADKELTMMYMKIDTNPPNKDANEKN